MGSPHPHPQLRELSMSAIAIRDEASLNVVIPMGGSAEAFREAGYVFPKPLIKIAGRPMLMHLLDNLRLRTGDVVWLVVPHDLHAQHDAEFDLVGRQYSGADIRTVVFKMQTRGAVETIFIGLQNMTPAELARKTICLDCDNLYFSDVLGDFRTLPKGQGACFYFIDTGTAALYSYLQTQSHGKDQVVIHVAEKVAISDRANCGAYGFASGSLLHKFSQACSAACPSAAHSRHPEHLQRPSQCPAAAPAQRSSAVSIAEHLAGPYCASRPRLAPAELSGSCLVVNHPQPHPPPGLVFRYRRCSTLPTATRCSTISPASLPRCSRRVTAFSGCLLTRPRCAARPPSCRSSSPQWRLERLWWSPSDGSASLSITCSSHTPR